VAAAEDEPHCGVNVRAKRRKGFARASHKHLDCPIAPAQRAQFLDYALAGASASMLAKRMNPGVAVRFEDAQAQHRIGMLAPQLPTLPLRNFAEITARPAGSLQLHVSVMSGYVQLSSGGGTKTPAHARP
jgi:hypothetical protein